MFYNFSNHASKNWTAEQVTAATNLCDELRSVVVDVEGMPNVDPSAEVWEVAILADHLIHKSGITKDDHALVTGEPTLTYIITRKLIALGCCVYSATSRRHVVESVKEDGGVVKTATFRFVQFRQYPSEF
jgi:hypothetical protein